MDFEDLTNKILNIITSWIIDNDNDNYEYINIPDCYYRADKDIKKISKIITSKLNLDIINNDIIQSYYNDYFIFKFRKLYIIINVNNDFYDNNYYEYKIIKVFNRNEALIYRYS